jgi:phage tail sheath protein FI
MPVSPTYPGVYIEEIPSGVHTITGVSTSVTAFVGFTPRGAVNRGTQLFSFADFERAFAGLSLDSDVSYAVKQFFENGGSEAWVVRVAANAKAASIKLGDKIAAPTPVLTATAASEGNWGNNLRIDVDYETGNPDSLFNLSASELVREDGVLKVSRTEKFANLSMNSFSPTYAEGTLNAASDLIRVARAAALLPANASALSGNLPLIPNIAFFGGNNNLLVAINGEATIPVSFDIGTAFIGLTDATRYKEIADRIAAAIKLINPAYDLDATVDAAKRLKFETKPPPDERFSIHFYNAPSKNAAALLKLGLDNGGREVDAVAGWRPARNGTVGGKDVNLGALAAGNFTVQAMLGATVLATQTFAVVAPVPTTLDDVRTWIAEALATSATPAFKGARVLAAGARLRVIPGGEDPNVRIVFNAGGLAPDLGFNPQEDNVGLYATGIGQTLQAQIAGDVGNDGTAPGVAEYKGSRSAKTGFYALENVDIFNILCIPNASLTEAQMAGIYAEVLAYCVERRAFLLIDLPQLTDTVPKAQQWLTNNATLRNRNAAAYFPWIRQPDPLQQSRLRAFPPCGVVAGLYARTDGERGVWKAPAGVDALMNGVLGLTYPLTNPENGALNPLALNCLRFFPAYGPVVWGARTLRGSDALADEYKYVPVRRLALFLEESLYRGTQWVVFEPNDEPLWAQIRLNLGAFMHTLFAQGAFKGQTPRDAYFVKCDKDTTTANDVDLGRVNIVVGFAPLKPAEFVIIKIQQIVPALQT